jgi:hypothetical protein
VAVLFHVSRSTPTPVDVMEFEWKVSVASCSESRVCARIENRHLPRHSLKGRSSVALSCYPAHLQYALNSAGRPQIHSQTNRVVMVLMREEYPEVIQQTAVPSNCFLISSTLMDVLRYNAGASSACSGFPNSLLEKTM